VEGSHGFSGHSNDYENAGNPATGITKAGGKAPAGIIQNLLDEAQWDTLYGASREQLVDAALEAKTEFAEGKAELLELSRL